MATGTIKSNRKTFISDSEFTRLRTFSSFECRATKTNDICTGFITLTNGETSALSGGTTELVGGFPKPFNSTSFQVFGSYVSGANYQKAIRGRINTEGVFQLWYGGDIPSGASVTFFFAYAIE